MGTSSITISALTATPTLRGNKLKATVVATGPAANIPNLMPQTVVLKASTTNDYSTATEVGRGLPEILDAGLIEEQTYYYWAYVVDQSGNVGAVFPVSPTGGVACTAIGMSGLAFGLANGKIVATVAGNALTIAVKTKAGNDPSDSDPVFLAQPNATVSVADYQTRRIASALSLTVSSGSTLGVDNTSTPFTLYLPLFDDAGTLRLGVTYRGSGETARLPLPDGGIASSTAEGGAGAADGNLIYTAVAVTSKPYRTIGLLTFSSGLATLGTWNVAPDVQRLLPPGAAPGEVLQEIYRDRVAGDVTTAVIPSDNSIPQIGEGGSANLSLQITPLNAANILEISAIVHASVSVAGEIIIAAFKDSDADAIAVGVGEAAVADKIIPIVLRHRQVARTTSQLAFSIRFGPASASTVTTNGASSAAKFNAKLVSSIVVRELRG